MTISKDLALKIIDAIRVGVPPKEGAKYYTKGRDWELEVIANELKGFSEASYVVKFVSGNYGDGKSHLMACAVDEGFEKDFVISRVDLTTDGISIRKEDSFVQQILKNVRMKEMGDKPAFMPLLETYADKLKKVITGGKTLKPDEYKRSLEGYLRKELHALGITQESVVNAMIIFCKAHEDGDYLKKSKIMSWFTEGVGKRDLQQAGVYSISVKMTRDVAIDILKTFAAVTRTAGYKGLLVTVDELDMVMRSLRADIRERVYEFIRGIINGQIPNTYFMFAFRPEMLSDVFAGFPSYKALHQVVTKSSKENPRGNMIEVNPLDDTTLFEIAKKIKDIHAVVYGWSPPATVNAGLLDVIKEARKKFGAGGAVNREILKMVVPFLDREQLKQTATP